MRWFKMPRTCSASLWPMRKSIVLPAAMTDTMVLVKPSRFVAALVMLLIGIISVAVPPPHARSERRRPESEGRRDELRQRQAARLLPLDPVLVDAHLRVPARNVRGELVEGIVRHGRGPSRGRHLSGSSCQSATTQGTLHPQSTASSRRGPTPSICPLSGGPLNLSGRSWLQTTIRIVQLIAWVLVAISAVTLIAGSTLPFAEEWHSGPGLLLVALLGWWRASLERDEARALARRSVQASAEALQLTRSLLTRTSPGSS